jgi:hypothetical protein
MVIKSRWVKSLQKGAKNKQILYTTKHNLQAQQEA